MIRITSYNVCYTKLLRPLSIYREIKIFPIYKENVLEKYMIDTGGGFFYFHYQRNPRYYFLYFIYFGVFLTA